jgi:hypothetical protein
MRNGSQLQGTKMLYPYKFAPLSSNASGAETARTLRQTVPGQTHRRILGNQRPRRRPVRRSPTARTKARRSASKSKPMARSFWGHQLRHHHATRFPLLVKLLDARERLSLQVHPPAGIAAKLKGEPKTEMWYVLEADQDAHLIAGLRRGITGADFMRALEGAAIQNLSPTASTVFPCCRATSSSFPSGRVHAIDAGVSCSSKSSKLRHDLPRLRLGPRRPRRQTAPASRQANRSCASTFRIIEPKKQRPTIERMASTASGVWSSATSFTCTASTWQRLARPLRRLDVSHLACIGGAVGIAHARRQGRTPQPRRIRPAPRRPRLLHPHAAGGKHAGAEVVRAADGVILRCFTNAPLHQLVQLTVFRAQVMDVRLDRERLAGGALHDLVRGELAAVLVDVFLEPTVQRAEFAAAIWSGIPGFAFHAAS